METENQIENPDYLELIKTKAISATFILFGNKRTIEFYQKRIKEFLNLFLPIKLARQLSLNFNYENFPKDFNTYPTSDFDAWDELHSVLSDPYWEEYTFWEIFNKFIEADTRVKIALAYCFGLIVGVNTEKEFIRYFNVSDGFVKSYSSIGINDFLMHIKKTGFNMLKPDHFERIRKFLVDLENPDSFDLYRFTGGRLIPHESSSYNLALLLSRKRKIHTSKLSQTQIEILNIFLRNRETDGTFIMPDDIGAEMNFPQQNIGYHIRKIIERLTVEQFYILDKDGNIEEMDKDSYQMQLILLSQKIPHLETHSTIPIEHRPIVECLITPNKDGIYSSVTSVASIFKFDSEYSLRTILGNILRRIKETEEGIDIYYYPDGVKVPEKSRFKLIKNKDDKVFRSKLTLEQLEFLDLITMLDGNRLVHTPESILKVLGIQSSNPERYVKEYVAFLVSRLEGDYPELILDERGQKIEKNHLGLINLVNKYGYKLAESLPETDQEIIKLVITKDVDGTYMSCLKLSKTRNMSYESMQNAISRCYKRYKALIEA